MNTLAIMALVGSISAVQLNREPLLTWSATPPATHPINYPVPDFGSSHEMIYTENNRKIAEAEGGEIPIDEKSPWPYTDTTVEFKLLQTDAKINDGPEIAKQGGEPGHATGAIIGTVVVPVVQAGIDSRKTI